MEITALEANYLLFCLDAYCKTDWRGKLTLNLVEGYSLEKLQELRDRLFAVHEHPEGSE